MTSLLPTMMSPMLELRLHFQLLVTLSLPEQCCGTASESLPSAPKQVFTKLLLCTRNDEVNALAEELSVTEDLVQKLETI